MVKLYLATKDDVEPTEYIDVCFSSIVKAYILGWLGLMGIITLILAIIYGISLFL